MKYIGLHDKSTQPCHIYYIADAAYRNMLLTKKGQVCVISGESGAGKTESSKCLIQQILDCSGHHSTGAGEIDADRERHPVEDLILDINPILEAFGNAQTVMNDNSSRFGKYIELQFQEKTGTVLGASLSHYLLEKSRVVLQGEGELNFRVFASLFAGGEKKIMSYYRLHDYNKHNYLPEGVDVKSPDLEKEWRSVQQAMFTIGFKDSERDDIVAALAGILHLGDITLAEEGANDGSTVPPSSNSTLVATTDALLVDDDDLVRALCTGEINIRGEITITSKNAKQASDTRDGAAKAIYERLFSWLVRRIDAVLAANPSSMGNDSDDGGDAVPSSADLKLLTVGILDIFGFEDFESNGFDQFCINLANERLQGYFNKHIFAAELEEYKNDGIAEALVQGITYTDNHGTLDLILTRQIGIIPLLNEACKFQTSTPNSLVEKLSGTHKDHPSFAASQTQGQFGIKHYAGDVVYSAQGFLEKNRDLLPPLVLDVLGKSGNPLIARLFQDTEANASGMNAGGGGGASAGGNRKSKHELGRTKSKGFFAGLSARFSKRPGGGGTKARGGKRSSTMATSFTKSLTKLMDKMEAANPHFVRCIKPNSEKVPEYYDAEMVLRQMRYNGLLATVQIRRQGYPNRLKHEALFEKFQGLVYNYTAVLAADQRSSSELMTKLTTLSEGMKATGNISHSGSLDNWLVGSTKAFLKHWHLDLLVTMQGVHQAAAVTIQANVRMFLCRKNFLKQLDKYRDECALAATFIVGIAHRAAHTFSALQALEDEEVRRGPVGLGIIKPEKKKKHKPPPAKINAKKFEKNLSKARKAAIKWWMKSERPRKFHIDASGNLHQWFHGLITRVEAEDFLVPCDSGTFLFRVSERYHGYALSVKIGDRIKHYKVSVEGVRSSKRLVLDGIDGDFESLVEIATRYATEPLPTLDGTTALLINAYQDVLHDLGLPIDRQDAVLKGAKKTPLLDGGGAGAGGDEDEDAAFEGLEALLEDVSGLTLGTQPSTTSKTGEDAGEAQSFPEDTAVFEKPAVHANGKTPRWLRGAISRHVAVNELATRGMVNGRFVVREKERKHDFVSFAISYSFEGKLFHHILCRRRAGFWAIDQLLLQFPDGRGRMCSVVEVVELLQTRRAPQLATSLELDAVLGPAPTMTAKTRPAATRGLHIRTGPDTLVNAGPLPSKLAATVLGPASKVDGSSGAPTSPRVNVLKLAGLGIGGPSNGAKKGQTLRPNASRNSPKAARKRPSSAFLGAPPPSRASGSSFISVDEPIYDTRTGRRVTGIPRVKLNAQSPCDDVCSWLVSLGLSHCMKKFVKKKVTGANLFEQNEKKLRKLVKAEDDFILLKRALRQAKAYAATIVPAVIVEEPETNEAGEEKFVQLKGKMLSILLLLLLF